MSVDLISSKEEYVGTSINRYYLAWQMVAGKLSPEERAFVEETCGMHEEETEEHKWMRRRILK